MDLKYLKQLPKVVIGIIYGLQSPNPTKGGLEAFGKSLPNKVELRRLMLDESNTQTRPITPGHFFPIVNGKTDFKNWFHHQGSLTSFPYTEDVSWFVMKSEAAVKPDEIKDLQELTEQDARELQPLDRRIVVQSF